MDDYYNGDFYEEALRRWVDENISKIKSIPNETLGSMREIILDGFKKGRTVTDISKEIQQVYGVTRRKGPGFGPGSGGQPERPTLEAPAKGCWLYQVPVVLIQG